MTKWLMDSNILLRISRRYDPDHHIVDLALERLLSGHAELYYTHQNIAELWNVWTRPANRNGFGLTSETAEQKTGRIESMMMLAADSAAVYEQWRRLVREYRVTGVQVHDARLVASMLVHRIPNLLTLNGADFQRWSKVITAVHPRSVAESTD
jgi:predicted nucleic acid-binding protein